MSTWHKEVTKSLADSVSAVLSDMKEDQKASQNKMMKKGKGEPAGQIKPKQDLPEEDEEENGNGNGKNGNGKNGKKLDPVNKKAVKKKFDDRKDKDIDNDGDTDSSDKFLHKKRKAITKAIRKTSRNGKKVDLSGKKEKVTVNPDMNEATGRKGGFVITRADLKRAEKRGRAREAELKKRDDARRRRGGKPESPDSKYKYIDAREPSRITKKGKVFKKDSDDRKTQIWDRLSGSKRLQHRANQAKRRAQEEDFSAVKENNFIEERAKLREELEASFDSVFRFSNKEEEVYRDQWMDQFDTIVTGKEPNAYIDPLQRRVFYIEGITPEQAAKRYLSHCVANASMAGGEYQNTPLRGGDKYSSAQHQGNPVDRVHHVRHRVNHR